MKKVVFEELEQSHGGYLCRAKVPGGWLVRLESPQTVVLQDEIKEGWDFSASMVFVPDPNYTWLTEE